MSGLSKNKIKWIRSLQLKKNRDAENVFVVEGEKMVTEAIHERSQDILVILHTQDLELPEGHYEKIITTEKELELVSSMKTPNKALAVLRKPSPNSAVSDQKMILALDGVQDPGNMGTILRIADWYGIKEVICSNDTVDCFNPKVVQSSMGAIFRVHASYTGLAAFLTEQTLPIYGALLEGKNVYQTDLSEPCILIMGNEGNGISKEIQQLITHPISIPRYGQAESLNVSVATGILVSEFVRRRG